MALQLRCYPPLPLRSCANQIFQAGRCSRSFSTTPRNDYRRPTRARRRLYDWLRNQGQAFRNPLPDSTNYMSAYNASGQLRRVEAAKAELEKQKEDKARREGKAPSDEKGKGPEDAKNKEDGKIPAESRGDLAPYPLNRDFISQPVLSDELRQEIWARVMAEGKSVRQVSAELKVEMRRVGAVVRLLEVEKEWERAGKRLAKPYHNAVMGMLQKTPYNPDKPPVSHESINDLPVHRVTGPQIFLPTSESRHFTRADAARAFREGFLPADERVPHPELAIMHREARIENLTMGERLVRNQAREAAEQTERKKLERKQAKLDAAITKVDTRRWEFHFTEINVEDAGKTGRGAKGTGWRYGAPLMDRTRGLSKIPTSA